ncbi:efflux RND transporter periplasmic adaptor subunit [Microcoleus sp. B5-D4]|uniref:efflux RND transporter periplasmic adaptor subunit n=1 Tax=Microcoleus sp. B5-D4 TaxID=2818681 RepID=UPI002FD4D269
MICKHLKAYFYPYVSSVAIPTSAISPAGASFIKAETEIKQAEVDLPMRELRESQGRVAEAKAQLTRAQSRREVLEAENQVKRGKTAVEVAQSRIRLADAAYQARLQQLGTVANDRGLVTVVAPISGTVADRFITPGESVNAEKPLMSLLNDSRVFATANIYEKDLNQVKQGQEVRVSESDKRGLFSKYWE